MGAGGGQRRKFASDAICSPPVRDRTAAARSPRHRGGTRSQRNRRWMLRLGPVAGRRRLPLFGDLATSRWQLSPAIYPSVRDKTKGPRWPDLTAVIGPIRTIGRAYDDVRSEVKRSKLLALNLMESDECRPRTHESENTWLQHGLRMRCRASLNDDEITISTAHGHDCCGVRQAPPRFVAFAS